MSEKPDSIALLRKVELFSTLSDEELEIVALHSQAVRYARGSLIFTEGSPGHEFYVIREGEVLISRHRGEDDIDIAQFIAGESFGEWDMIGDTERSATAVAMKDTALLVFPREGFTFPMFLQKYPKMSARMLHKLLAIIARRIRSTQGLITEKTPWVRTLRKQMHGDKLTGLYNRDYLFEESESLFGRGGSGALMIIKPDNFKELNDAFGHQAGDRALVLISIFLQSALRESHVPLRYGGDEFAALLPGAGREEALATAREVGTALGGIDLEGVTGERDFRLSSSIGIAFYPDHGRDTRTLAAHARARMLRARGMGGNRIVAAGTRDAGPEPVE
ncbi:MAG: GGDEF domain-containing protein [Spirochaetes bacterium]|nr:GGDEF domain-containing protein [Spirochaetota bacterium]